jgi:hypothetical protein
MAEDAASGGRFPVTVNGGPHGIRFVAVEVAGKPSRSRLLHRHDCMHLRWKGEWPAPVLREATAEELRSRRRCRSCIDVEARERGLR